MALEDDIRNLREREAELDTIRRTIGAEKTEIVERIANGETTGDASEDLAFCWGLDEPAKQKIIDLDAKLKKAEKGSQVLAVFERGELVKPAGCFSSARYTSERQFNLGVFQGFSYNIPNGTIELNTEKTADREGRIEEGGIIIPAYILIQSPTGGPTHDDIHVTYEGQKVRVFTGDEVGLYFHIADKFGFTGNQLAYRKMLRALGLEIPEYIEQRHKNHFYEKASEYAPRIQIKPTQRDISAAVKILHEIEGPIILKPEPGVEINFEELLRGACEKHGLNYE